MKERKRNSYVRQNNSNNYNNLIWSFYQVFIWGLSKTFHSNRRNVTIIRCCKAGIIIFRLSQIRSLDHATLWWGDCLKNRNHESNSRITLRCILWNQKYQKNSPFFRSLVKKMSQKTLRKLFIKNLKNILINS